MKRVDHQIQSTRQPKSQDFTPGLNLFFSLFFFGNQILLDVINKNPAISLNPIEDDALIHLHKTKVLSYNLHQTGKF